MQADAVASDSSRRAQASAVVAAAASNLQSLRLSALATQVRVVAFTRVKKAIDDMVTQLLAEKVDEIKHKGFCVDVFNENQFETETKEREEQDETAKIEDLDMTIAKLAKAING